MSRHRQPQPVTPEVDPATILHTHQHAIYTYSPPPVYAHGALSGALLSDDEEAEASQVSHIDDGESEEHEEDDEEEQEDEEEEEDQPEDALSETSSADYDPDADPDGFAQRLDQLAGVEEMSEIEAHALRSGPAMVGTLGADRASNDRKGGYSVTIFLSSLTSSQNIERDPTRTTTDEGIQIIHHAPPR